MFRPHQLGLDEVTDHLVVEVLDGGPLDPFLDVLLLQTSTGVSTCTCTLLPPSRPAHLLRLQRQLDEDLLQLLVDKVDAELLKPVFLQENKVKLSPADPGGAGWSWVEPAQKNPALLAL